MVETVVDLRAWQTIERNYRSKEFPKAVNRGIINNFHALPS
jgi:hypothetical protein